MHSDVVEHPLLGDAHVIEYQGEPITAMSAIDWDAPTRIPTVAEPRKLPRGSGSALVNEIALRARAAGVQALRYAGPYPTPALFNTLLRSFRTTASEAEFSADVLDRAMRVARDEMPIDFAPAPFERRTMPYGSIDVRDGIERAVIDGVLYDRDGTIGSLARLAGHSAQLAFEDVMWTRVAELDEHGALLDGPRPIPALTGEMIGAAFPSELKQALGELVADAVPPPLASDAREVVRARNVTWADLGWRAAARNGDDFTLHAGWWLYLAPRGIQTFALAVADALAAVVTQAILDEVS